MSFIKGHPVLSGGLIFFAVLVLAAVITGILVMQAAQGKAGDCEYVILLGTAVHGDKPSSMLADRIRGAYTYLTEHPDVICIVSGGKAREDRLSEAQCMYNELTAMGIAPDRIILEDQATSTRENLIYSVRIIEERTGTHPETVGIISSELHLFRGEMFAREQQVSAVTFPAKTSSNRNFVIYFLREILLVWYYSIF
jgi:uncharacterized SAM-binding protein YcdF (DUF218 family)